MKISVEWRRLTFLAVLFWACFSRPTQAQGPSINPGGVLNGASFTRQLAAGSIASVFGRNLASSTAPAGSLPLPTTLGGATLQIAGQPVPQFYASPAQINFQVPWELTGQPQGSLKVSVGGMTSSEETFQLVTYAPAIFAVDRPRPGQGAILISGTGGALAAPVGVFPGSRPVRAGEILEFFCTGLGPVNNSPATGEVAPSDPLATTGEVPRVTIGGIQGKVLFSGLAPGFVGLYQVNVQVPVNAPTGDAVPVELSIAEVLSNTVSIALQPPAELSVSVSISPATASIQVGSGSSLQFTAAVTGTADTGVTWALLTPFGAGWGFIDQTGLYRAPFDLPTPATVAIVATSTYDPTKYASATVTLTPRQGQISVRISPVSPVVAFGQSLRFTATVEGTDNPAVFWSAREGSISSDGLFIAPPIGTFVNVSVVSAADSTARASTTVRLIAPPPVITQISPREATAGEEITISGQNFFSSIPPTVFFPGPNGVVIPVSPQYPPATQSFEVVVPQGASTGPLSLQMKGDLWMRSNSVTFTRMPRLRIRAERKDIAAGESTRFQVRFLGDANPRALTWSTEQGSISSGGVYQAPSNISADRYTLVTACIQGTEVCDSQRLGLHPFRIEPPTPVVAMGQTLQLTAVVGNSTVTPVWALEAGGGTVSPGGLYTAPTTVADSGGIALAASYNNSIQRSSVSVTGAFPGLVNRIYDYPADISPAVRRTRMPVNS